MDESACRKVVAQSLHSLKKDREKMQRKLALLKNGFPLLCLSRLGFLIRHSLQVSLSEKYPKITFPSHFSMEDKYIHLPLFQVSPSSPLLSLTRLSLSWKSFEIVVSTSLGQISPKVQVRNAKIETQTHSTTAHSPGGKNVSWQFLKCMRKISLANRLRYKVWDISLSP